MRHIHEFVETRARTFVKGNVLDVGGGEGRWKKVLGGSQEYIIADPFAKAADLKDDAANLSCPDESFGTVVCFEVFEHLEDPIKVIPEMYRVLRPGGCAIVSVPFLYPYHANPIDYWRISPEALGHVFKQAGFEVVETGRIGNLITVLGVIAKSKMKRATNPFSRKVAYLAHRLCLGLARIYPASRPSPFFFTHSYVIGQKIGKG